MNVDGVRWMVSFWHPEGGRRDEPNFPDVEFWHADRETSMVEAARVLIELREVQEDERDWAAAGAIPIHSRWALGAIPAGSGSCGTAT